METITKTKNCNLRNDLNLLLVLKRGLFKLSGLFEFEDEL